MEWSGAAEEISSDQLAAHYRAGACPLIFFALTFKLENLLSPNAPATSATTHVDHGETVYIALCHRVGAHGDWRRLYVGTVVWAFSVLTESPLVPINIRLGEGRNAPRITQSTFWQVTIHVCCGVAYAEMELHLISMHIRRAVTHVESTWVIPHKSMCGCSETGSL